MGHGGKKNQTSDHLITPNQKFLVESICGCGVFGKRGLNGGAVSTKTPRVRKKKWGVWGVWGKHLIVVYFVGVFSR